MHGHGHVHGHVHAACACGAHDTRLAVAPWQALTGKQLEAVVGSVDAKNPALMLIAAYVATQCIDGDRAETNLFLDWSDVRERASRERADMYMHMCM